MAASRESPLFKGGPLAAAAVRRLEAAEVDGGSQSFSLDECFENGGLLPYLPGFNADVAAAIHKAQREWLIRSGFHTG